MTRNTLVMVVVVAALLLLLGASAQSINLRGVDPKDPRYKSLFSKPAPTTFSCSAGSTASSSSSSSSSSSKTIPIDLFNDDYCDCPLDGSDEPGTSACSLHPKAKFTCTNVGYIPESIHTSRVNDGICDCCDGADEYETTTTTTTTTTKCLNTCKELAQRVNREHVQALAQLRSGLEKKRKLISLGTELITKLKSEQKDVQDQLQREKNELSRLEKEKELNEKREDLEKQHIKQKLEKEEEEAASAGSASAAPPPTPTTTTTPENVIPAEEPPHQQQEPNNADDDDDEPGLPVGDNGDGATDFPDTTEPEHDHDAPEPQSRHTETDDEEIDDTNEQQPEPEPDSHEEREEEDTREKLEKERERRIKEAVDAVKLPDAASPTNAPPPKSESTGGWLDRVFHFLKRYLLRPLSTGYVSAVRIFYGSFNKTEAELTREAYDKKKSEVENLQRRVDDLNKLLEDTSDCGPEKEYFSYKHDKQCLSYDTREYVYEICFYGEATQKDKKSNARTSLGKWVGFENDHRTLVFENGQSCWNGPKRSIRLQLRCGPNFQFVAVEEPQRCVYSGIVETPATCREADLAQVEAKLLK